MCKVITKKDKKDIFDLISEYFLSCQNKIEQLYTTTQSTPLQPEQLDLFLRRIENYDDILQKINRSIIFLEDNIYDFKSSADLYQQIKVIVNSLKFILLDIEDNSQIKNTEYLTH